MTDDEQAARVLEMLAGVRRCEGCHHSMQRAKLTEQLVAGVASNAPRTFVGWYCAACNHYVLDDGTEIEAGAGGDVFLRERDFYWDEQLQQWVPDEIG